MASWLVIDWDQDQFHLLCAQSARRGVQVTRAATWTHPEPFTPSTAERVGKALREFLKSAKIPNAPVIVGLGRDRIFLKELRFPAIAAHEEAPLVRFQTGKELTESIDNYGVDYVHMNPGGGERQVMTVAVRRDLLAMVQTLCLAAGLKLHAITPKLFGTGQALIHALHPEASPLTADRLNVILSIGQRWAELCFFRGERLLQTQALANGPLLASEVKRNLAVFRAQHAVDAEVDEADCLYVFGDAPAAVQALQAAQSLPIRVLDPLAQEPDVASQAHDPTLFAGAVGLAALWSQGGAKPVNLAAPKRAQAPAIATRQRGILYGAAAAVLVLFMVGGMYAVLANQRRQIENLAAEKAKFESDLKDNAQERADLDAYKEWEQTTIPWLDELYDVTARFPWKKDFRANMFAGTPGAKKAGKEKELFTGAINMNVIAPRDNDIYITQLKDALASDKHLRTALAKVKHGAGKAPDDWPLKIDVAKQAAKKYDTRLVVPPPTIIRAPAPVLKKEEPMPEGDGQGEGGDQ